MAAQQALADLTEISSQIEVAAICAAGGSVIASTLADAARASSLGSLVTRLLEATPAAGPATAELEQLEAATDEGSVFLVRDGGLTIVAVTKPQPTSGLVFYDLKSALRSAAAGVGGEA